LVLVLGFLTDTPTSDEAAFIDSPHEPCVRRTASVRRAFSDHYEVS